MDSNTAIAAADVANADGLRSVNHTCNELRHSVAIDWSYSGLPYLRRNSSTVSWESSRPANSPNDAGCDDAFAEAEDEDEDDRGKAVDDDDDDDVTAEG